MNIFEQMKIVTQYQWNAVIGCGFFCRWEDAVSIGLSKWYSALKSSFPVLLLLLFFQDGNFFLKKIHSDILMTSQHSPIHIGKLIIAVYDELKNHPDISFVQNISYRLGVHSKLRQWEKTYQGTHADLLSKISYVIEIWECSMDKCSFGGLVYTFISLVREEKSATKLIDTLTEKFRTELYQSLMI